MKLSPYFSSSAKIWDDIEWVYGIEEAGYSGWEIVADGNYRLDDPSPYKQIQDVVRSTKLGISVHAPYGDLNLATLNDPIWQESIHQICTCIEKASALTDRVTIHPGYLSPAGRLMPEKAWELQKEALRRIGKFAVEHSVIACLENMVGIKEFLCRDPGELMGMVDGIEGVGMTFDLGHANTMGLVPEFLAEIGHAQHIHVHDNNGMSDEHLALGDGTIDWKRAGKKIAAGYRGVVVVEGRSIPEAKRSLAVFRECFL